MRCRLVTSGCARGLGPLYGTFGSRIPSAISNEILPHTLQKNLQSGSMKSNEAAQGN